MTELLNSLKERCRSYPRVSRLKTPLLNRFAEKVSLERKHLLMENGLKQVSQFYLQLRGTKLGFWEKGNKLHPTEKYC